MTYTQESLQKLKVSELKEILAGASLETAGKKNELISRILEHVTNAPSPAKVSASPVAAAAGFAACDNGTAKQPLPTTSFVADVAAVAASPSLPTNEQLIAKLKQRQERFGLESAGPLLEKLLDEEKRRLRMEKFK